MSAKSLLNESNLLNGNGILSISSIIKRQVPNTSLIITKIFFLVFNNRYSIHTKSIRLYN